jgi:hypothetical protein
VNCLTGDRAAARGAGRRGVLSSTDGDEHAAGHTRAACGLSLRQALRHAFCTSTGSFSGGLDVRSAQGPESYPHCRQSSSGVPSGAQRLPQSLRLSS